MQSDSLYHWIKTVETCVILLIIDNHYDADFSDSKKFDRMPCFVRLLLNHLMGASMKHKIFLATLASFAFLATPSFAFQAYICGNKNYRLIACVSNSTDSAANDGRMHFDSTDFVKIIERDTGKTFRFGSILYHISGGGGSRFQSFTHKGYAYFLDDTRVLDVSYGDDGGMRGHFLEQPGVRPENNQSHYLDLECPHNIFGATSGLRYGQYLDSENNTFKTFSCKEFEDNVFSKKYSTYYGDESEYPSFK